MLGMLWTVCLTSSMLLLKLSEWESLCVLSNLWSSHLLKCLRGIAWAASVSKPAVPGSWWEVQWEAAVTGGLDKPPPAQFQQQPLCMRQLRCVALAWARLLQDKTHLNWSWGAGVLFDRPERNKETNNWCCWRGWFWELGLRLLWPCAVFLGTMELLTSLSHLRTGWVFQALYPNTSITNRRDWHI